MECVWRGRGGDLAAPGTVGKKWRSVESVPVKHRLQDAIALRTERVNSLQMRPEGVGEEAPTPYPRPPIPREPCLLLKAFALSEAGEYLLQKKKMISAADFPWVASAGMTASRQSARPDAARGCHPPERGVLEARRLNKHIQILKTPLLSSGFLSLLLYYNCWLFPHPRPLGRGEGGKEVSCNGPRMCNQANE